MSFAVPSCSVSSCVPAPVCFSPHLHCITFVSTALVPSARSAPSSLSWFLHSFPSPVSPCLPPPAPHPSLIHSLFSSVVFACSCRRSRIKLLWSQFDEITDTSLCFFFFLLFMFHSSEPSSLLSWSCVHVDQVVHSFTFHVWHVASFPYIKTWSIKSSKCFSYIHSLKEALTRTDDSQSYHFVAVWQVKYATLSYYKLICCTSCQKVACLHIRQTQSNINTHLKLSLRRPDGCKSQIYSVF